jgi:4-hydroxy-2-oxoheptanedioate aldolase
MARASNTIRTMSDQAAHPLEVARRLRERWLKGETTFGGWIYFRDSFSVEVVARANLDWMCIDTQHGMARGSDVAPLMQAVALAGQAGVVRVPWNEPGVIMNALDAGASGVIVPLVSSPVEAERAVFSCRYPPRGIRSWGPTRAALGAADYSAGWANERVLCIVMIETEEGAENVESILAVPGIDGVFIGPSDLALSYNVQRADPANHRRIAAIKEACDACGVPTGVAVTSVDEARRYAASGFAFIALPSDAVLLGRVYATFLAAIRDPAAAEW